MNILQLLASSSFITLNKNVIKVVGLEEALLLGELCSEYDYWIKREELQDGYFFSTVENIEENTTLNDYKQRKALKSLQQLKIVDVKVKGLPAKRYFKINEEQLIKLLNIQYSNNLKYSSQNFKELDTKNFECNKNKQNKNKDNNKKINKKDLENEFNELWELYPKKQGKKKALDKYIQCIKNNITNYEIVKEGIINYNRHIEKNKVSNQYIKQGSTWFNQECWNDQYDIEPQKQLIQRNFEKEFGEIVDDIDF